jgi:predicted  nucleic acid-binding Zn-ribbon protein
MCGAALPAVLRSMSIDRFIADTESARAETRRLQQELRRLRAEHQKARESLRATIVESQSLRAEVLALREDIGCRTAQRWPSGP